MLFGKHIRYWVILLIAFSCIPASAWNTDPQSLYEEEAVENRAFDREDWVRVVRGMKFDEKPSEDKEPVEYQTQTRNTGAWAGFWKVILIVVLVIIVALILVNMLGGEALFGARDKKLKKEKKKITLENLEEHIEEAEIDRFIQQAINSKDFKLAIRLHYLAIIKALASRRFIKWKRDKTNGDYLREVSASVFFDRFQNATLAFERAWYGDKALDQSAFQELQPGLLSLEREIMAINPKL